MTYENIIKRIQDNLGLPVANGVFRATARRDIYDVLNLIVRKTEYPKKLYSVTIDTDEDDATNPTSSASMPTDFYIPIEVMFFASSGNRFPEIEMTRETYERWNPDVNLVTSSFNDLVTGATPQELIWTSENFDYDGYIGYTFTETEPRTIEWKPAVNGTLKVYYVEFFTQFTAGQYSNSPSIHSVFDVAIISSVTTKMLIRKLHQVKDEVGLIALRTQISEFKQIAKDSLADLVGYVQKTAETSRVEPFNFLSDPAMLLDM